MNREKVKRIKILNYASDETAKQLIQSMKNLRNYKDTIKRKNSKIPRLKTEFSINTDRNRKRSIVMKTYTESFRSSFNSKGQLVKISDFIERRYKSLDVQKPKTKRSYLQEIKRRGDISFRRCKSGNFVFDLEDQIRGVKMITNRPIHSKNSFMQKKKKNETMLGNRRKSRNYQKKRSSKKIPFFHNSKEFSKNKKQNEIKRIVKSLRSERRKSKTLTDYNQNNESLTAWAPRGKKLFFDKKKSRFEFNIGIQKRKKFLKKNTDNRVQKVIAMLEIGYRTKYCYKRRKGFKFNNFKNKNQRKDKAGKKGDAMDKDYGAWNCTDEGGFRGGFFKTDFT